MDFTERDEITALREMLREIVRPPRAENKSGPGARSGRAQRKSLSLCALPPAPETLPSASSRKPCAPLVTCEAAGDESCAGSCGARGGRAGGQGGRDSVRAPH